MNPENMYRLATARQVLKRGVKQHRTSRIIATFDHQHAFKAMRNPEPNLSNASRAAWL
jgi:hypothetical protein